MCEKHVCNPSAGTCENYEVSAYCFYYRIRHQSKQSYILSNNHNNNKLKEVDFNNI